MFVCDECDHVSRDKQLDEKEAVEEKFDEEISDDEEDATISDSANYDYVMKEFQYLCPISCCTYAIFGDSEALRTKHLKEYHDRNTDLKFLKLLGEAVIAGGQSAVLMMMIMMMIMMKGDRAGTPQGPCIGKIHKCEECGREFTNRDSAILHRKKHNNERTHWCGKGFFRASCLQVIR